MIGIDLFFKSLATCFKIAEKGLATSLKMMEAFTSIPGKTFTSSQENVSEENQMADDAVSREEPEPPGKKEESEEVLEEKITPESSEPQVKPPVKSPQTPSLTAGSETIAKSEKKAMEKKVKKKTARKTDKESESAVDQVKEFIAASKQGAKSADIREATGFDAKKVQNIVYRLKRKGEIKTIKKGVYTKA